MRSPAHAAMQVGANQRHANQGIYILCKAVSELMQVRGMEAWSVAVRRGGQRVGSARARAQGLCRLLPLMRRAGGRAGLQAPAC